MKEKLQGFLKFVLALAVPGMLIYFWISAQKMADVEVDKFTKDKAEHPDQSNTTVKNYELKEVNDANEMKWHLRASEGVMQNETKDVQLKDVSVEYYNDKKIKMKMSAPKGMANETTRLVNLGGDDKNRVICEGDEGKSRMEANFLTLDKENKFTANGGVNILWTGVAKVTGNKATGNIDKTAQLQNIKVIGNTHSYMSGKGAEPTTM
ncbi:MAG TPA: LPS export ABC transporter periplasmic protein LptC [Drouetiella sp.]